MLRPLITIFGTIAGIIMLLSFKPHVGPQAALTPQVSGSAPNPQVSGSAPSSGGGGLTDGTYQGKTVDTEYGPVQVEITVSGGRLTAVHVLRTPSDNARDREIAASAVPRLTKKALKAGNANIDMVSGATYTSEGYISSLQSALDQAHG